MTKFKVGDKVKIVENSSYSVNKVGEIGVVTYVDENTCFVEVVKGRKGRYYIHSDLELVTEPKFYEEVVTRKVVLNRDYVTTNLPSGSEFVTSGSSECVTICSGTIAICSGTVAIFNDDIPAIISHLQQWYDAVQLEKSNEPL